MVESLERFVDQVVTLSDTREGAWYEAGEPTGSARVPDIRIDGCAARGSRVESLPVPGSVS